MGLDVSTVIVGYDGAPAREAVFDDDGNQIGTKPLTVRAIFSTALNQSLPDERLTQERKAHFYSLSVRLFESDTPSFTPSELALIQERVGVHFPPLVVGRIGEMIDALTAEPA